MLKIYRIHDFQGKIVLDDYIEFKYGRFNTGLNGFGDVLGGDVTKSLQKVNYEYLTIKNYVSTSKSFAKLRDGYVTNFSIWNPFSYDELEEEFKNVPKTEKDYEKFGLNEEGILLFTDMINLKYKNDAAIERIFGRWPENGMYLIKPGTTFTAETSLHPVQSETYEVLQSKNLGKQLVLNKLNRKIY